jgi:NAD(P)-dependent dehydrogenase (short-subunit alcohol dehydrogenase family)
MSINVRRLFLCMKYEIQQMLNQGSGAIVNNSSTVGLIGYPTDRSVEVVCFQPRLGNLKWLASLISPGKGIGDWLRHAS